MNNMEQIPQHLHNGLIDYVKEGTRPGAFLYACLTNNLIEAICRADSVSMQSIKEIVLFIYNDMPSSAIGSVEKVEKWISAKINERLREEGRA